MIVSTRYRSYFDRITRPEQIVRVTRAIAD